MLLNNWLSLNDMSRTLHEVDRLFEAVNRQAGFRSVSHQAYPAINLYDQDDQAVLVADVPGLDPKTLELTVLDDTLTLQGERPNDLQDQEQSLLHERPYGSFQRTITLPDSVDPDSIQAQYQQGVLTVTMQKVEAVKPRRIKINAS